MRMEDPQEDHLAVRCFCVCSWSALLGDLLGVSRSRDRDLQSFLFIYPRFICVCSLCIVAFFVFVLFCYNLMHVRCFGLVVNTCLPLPFGRICFVVLVMRKGGESSWSGPWHLGCTSEVSFSMCTATRTSSYSPVGPSEFYIYPRFVFCVFVSLSFVCVSPSFCVSLSSWVISLTGFGAGVRN